VFFKSRVKCRFGTKTRIERDRHCQQAQHFVYQADVKISQVGAAPNTSWYKSLQQWQYTIPARSIIIASAKKMP